MKWIAKQKRAASGAAHKTVNPPYVAIIRRIVFCMIFKLAGGKPFAASKSTGDSRFSGARGCSRLDGTK